MSRKTHSGAAGRVPDPAAIFAALGDSTRLSLLAALAGGEARSIARLTEGSGLTRRAISKHLRVLEKTRMVRCVRAGRESHYALDPQPLAEARTYLEGMSRLWDERLLRLKAHIESDRST
jgi:DNA-binding transcriptional ArsR family regulator